MATSEGSYGVLPQYGSVHGSLIPAVYLRSPTTPRCKAPAAPLHFPQRYVENPSILPTLPYEKLSIHIDLRDAELRFETRSILPRQPYGRTIDTVDRIAEPAAGDLLNGCLIAERNVVTYFFQMSSATVFQVGNRGNALRSRDLVFPNEISRPRVTTRRRKRRREKWV